MSSLAARMTKLEQHLAKQRAAASPKVKELLRDIRRDGSLMMSLAGMEPDPWQRDLLRSESKQILMIASRQSGKTQVASAIALREALIHPNALVLIVSPTLRQSGECLRAKVLPLYYALGEPVPATSMSQLSLTLANGSRIISLPSNESGLRGYSKVAVVVIDEASRVADDLYRAIRPFLAVSGGRLIALSTPFGKRGWLWDEFSGTNNWERVTVTAYQCSRISKEFLLREYRSLGQRYFSQEYEVSWVDAIDAVFSHADIMAALENPDGFEPLFPDDEDEDEDDDTEMPPGLLMDRNPRLDD